MKNAVEITSKLYGIWCYLSVCGFIETGHPLIRICRQVEDDTWPEVLVGVSSMWYISNFSTNTQNAYTAGRGRLNTSQMRGVVSHWMNAVILGVHADAWVPQAMDFYRDCCNQAGPTWTMMPFTTYSSIRVVDGHHTTLGSALRYPCCHW